MVLSDIGAVFGIGCLGGALGELLKWYQLRESTNFPEYARRWIYWVLTILMIAAGGGLAVLYGSELKNALLVANVGLSAPLVIKGLASNTPATGTGGARPPTRGGGKGSAPATILNFLAGR
jgi:hypothetical protein